MSEKLEQKQPQILLEIGPGISPVVLNGDRTFQEDQIYIGIDIAEGHYFPKEEVYYGDRVRQFLPNYQGRVNLERPNERIQFLYADGSNIPLPDSSVSEVYLANIMTSPIPSSKKSMLLQEVVRVLDNEGKLIIKVNWGGDFWLWPEEEGELHAMAKAHGFIIEDSIDSLDNQPKYDELERRFGQTVGAEGKRGYFVIASKPTISRNPSRIGEALLRY